MRGGGESIKYQVSSECGCGEKGLIVGMLHCNIRVVGVGIIFLVKENMSDVEIKYPYIPEGRRFEFVGVDDEWMRLAKEMADTKTGCSWWPTGAVVVKNGRVIGEGANYGELTIPCPRVEKGCKTGEGYDLCNSVCKREGYGHSEFNAVADALKKGEDVSNSDVYLFGHWWCCEPCWKSMIDAGVANVYLVENAHILFDTEKRKEFYDRIIKEYSTDQLSVEKIRWEI